MNREVHVRFCEGVGVKFPRATRPLIHTRLEFAAAQDIGKRQRATLKKMPPLTDPAKASGGFGGEGT